jgi:hypothetical protein
MRPNEWGASMTRAWNEDRDPNGDRMAGRIKPRLLDDTSHYRTNLESLTVGVTVVTGSTKYGHALLRVRYQYASKKGDCSLTKSSYFHCTDPGTTNPRYIDGKEWFDKYISTNKKQIVGTCWFYENLAKNKKLWGLLQEYVDGKTYYWGGIHHNCWSFATQMAKEAGWITPSFGAKAMKTPIQFLEVLGTEAGDKKQQHFDVEFNEGYNKK